MFLSQRNRDNPFADCSSGYYFFITTTKYPVDDRNHIYKGKM